MHLSTRCALGDTQFNLQIVEREKIEKDTEIEKKLVLF